MREPKVSILIPCYNAERWIAEAIESTLNQTYPNKEVIVVDDGSTDNSLEIIKSFGDRLIWDSGANQGGNAARNRLLEMSNGEWLQYLDADDYLLPKKITHQMEFIQQYPDIDIVYSPIIYECYDDNQTTQTILPIPEPHDPWILLARWFLPQTGSPLWRKQALVDVGCWKIDQPCCQEHELYLRLLHNRKKFAYFSKAESVYRQWSQDTVCKKDIRQTQLKRLEIKDKLEMYLRETQQLTPARLHAINQARFECARQIWLFDRDWAKQLAQQIKSTEKNFIPSGLAAPKLYQLMYQWMGFTAAERIAEWKRILLKS